jgi:hypothetical protein
MHCSYFVLILFVSDKAAVEVASKLSHDALERDDSMPGTTITFFL